MFVSVDELWECDYIGFFSLRQINLVSWNIINIFYERGQIFPDQP